MIELKGCAADKAGACGVKEPEEGDVLSPWVKVKFLNGGAEITVGNKSSPDNDNEAVIKSFEYATTDGYEAKLEIHDQKGGSFEQFMNTLLKSIICLDTNPGIYTAEITFGWIKASCGEQCSNVIDFVTSCKYYMTPNTVETNFNQGKFMFTITFIDMLSSAINIQHLPDVIGTDADRVYITDAITNLMTNDAPKVKSVKFLKSNGLSTDGTKNEPSEIEWKDPDGDPKKGVKGIWSLSLRDKLSATKDWLAELLTKDEKTVVPKSNSCEIPGDEIVFWEDPKPKPNEEVKSFFCFGTYIVNGGKDSRVIEFNPRINWNFSQLSVGGNMPDIGPTGGLEEGGAKLGLRESIMNGKNKSYKYIGAETSAGASVTLQDKYLSEANKIASDANSLQLRSMNLTYESIDADLVIIGDPKIGPMDIFGKWATIVFLNPYYISEMGKECGEWLAEPSCNPILSNRGWLINTLNHKIQNGSFVTTLSLTLLAPGSDIDPDKPLGADSGGKSFKSNC